MRFNIPEIDSSSVVFRSFRGQMIEKSSREREEKEGAFLTTVRVRRFPQKRGDEIRYMYERFKETRGRIMEAAL